MIMYAFPRLLGPRDLLIYLQQITGPGGQDLMEDTDGPILLYR